MKAYNFFFYGDEVGIRHTYEYVEGYFSDNGCELLEERYINNRTPMGYMCECGNCSKISFDSFKRNRRCVKCGGSEKLTYKYVRQYFEDRNCELMDDEYINNSSKMKYRCNCGNVSEICFSDFKSGRRCMECSIRTRAENLRHTYEYVYDYFKKYDCELLEKEYVNTVTLMSYRCSCKSIEKIRFDDFKSGHRCKKCGIEKISGKNNVNYNHNLTEEERRIKRKYPEYKAWVKKVFMKNNYTCQKCDKRGSTTLNAHHIENYAENIELRLKEKNGVTFCECCHKKFHKKYGYKNNNKKQLREFIEI